MSKVKFKYRLKDYKYKQKTLAMKLPTNENGFVLFDDITKILLNYLKVNEENAVLINFQVIEKYA